MFGRLAKFFRPLAPARNMPSRYEGPYRVYTDQYDRIVSADELDSVVSDTPDLRLLERPDLSALDKSAAAHYEQAAGDLAHAIGGRTDLAVTLLLDHSGSTRGQKIGLIAVLAGVVSECLQRASAPHEVLGFTTVNWRGGRSARAWQAAGAPSQPGRLCDLLHIVHRAYDDDASLRWEAMSRMIDPYLLKENVDGEAVLWAVSRLRDRPEARKVLIVVSDGAPVDDATLLANGPNILDDHLRQVCATTIGAQEIELFGIGVGYKMFRYYPQYCVVDQTKDIGLIALPVLRAVLNTTVHRANALS